MQGNKFILEFENCQFIHVVQTFDEKNANKHTYTTNNVIITVK